MGAFLLLIVAVFATIYYLTVLGLDVATDGVGTQVSMVAWGMQKWCVDRLDTVGFFHAGHESR